MVFKQFVTHQTSYNVRYFKMNDRFKHIKFLVSFFYETNVAEPENPKSTNQIKM